jgi:hypothetical protein
LPDASFGSGWATYWKNIVQPIDPNDDDRRLDALLSHARWPEPLAASTLRLRATWAGVSPARQSGRRWGLIVATAAVVVIGIGLVAALLVNGRPAEQAHEDSVRSALPPQTSPALIAATTRRAAVRDVGRLASTTGTDLTASQKLAIWSEIRRAARTGPNRRAAVVTPAPHAPSRQMSRPPVYKISTGPDIGVGAETAANVVAMRVQLSRG